MSIIKRQQDMTLEDEPLRLNGINYASGDQQTISSSVIPFSLMFIFVHQATIISHLDDRTKYFMSKFLLPIPLNIPQTAWKAKSSGP